MTRTGIERISSNDLTVLATDRGPAPMHIAAVLEFEAGAVPAFAEVAAVLEQRIPRIPRLRRRLMRTPPGAGRPVWVDDPTFRLDRHLSETEVAGGQEGILRTAAHLACRRLQKDRPPWAAHWVHGGPREPAALVFVAHHVLADGLGGLAVLASLGDTAPAQRAPAQPAPQPPPAAGTAGPAAFPQPQPRPRDLFVDAWAERLSALARVPRALPAAVAGLRELGLIGGGRRHAAQRGQRPGPRSARARVRAARTSYNRPTGSRRSITALAVPLSDVLDAAHARHCTLNDLVLVAVAGALGTALRARGESPGSFVVSVPISSRRGTEAATLGNANGVVPIEVPSDPDPAVRLARVMEQTAARRGARRGTSAGPLGVAFRTLARAGVFQRFIDHQRLVNTFLSNMRGPAEPLMLAGHRVTRIIPASMTPGNVGVCFTVLSYAGQLVVTVLADPGVVPEQDELTSLLSGELARLTG
ncbi:hypothetical protein SA2016_1300 [Sinomonas atrocyanea]|uniref:diacylglycerol O-acyltransferase n=1 Tax=Sinomonas atrocyanea TaxID=37927 RepID=A0A126ZXS9_9MICC|nr:wax ester/triacylglycerol synthase domain-containing protein [Sinomonas atrocyanea]AMM31980.1 hypothetical protein SA2016_1300 [Sinomonas atrocyanea]GEB65396.1 diacylglycerol O-acyltransferase [Sinomonas atrocyanea]GGG77737.1 diacylglycerol O-acyltransferase [Sinomonas atrocyanea]